MIKRAWNRIRQGGYVDLPDRDLRLKFDLPYLWSDKRYAPELKIRELVIELRTHSRNQADLLEFLHGQSSRLAKFKVPVKKRLTMLELMLGHAAPLLNTIYSHYKKEEGIPESQGRRNSLDTALHIIRDLIIGYQQVFQQAYKLPNFRYGYARKRLRLAAIRILELIYTEQRFCAMRYQPFPAQRWHDLNQLFFILWHYEDVDLPVKLMGCLQTQLREHEVRGGNGGKTLTPTQLYLAIQLFGVTDAFTWPGDFIQVVDNYLQMLESKIVITEDKGGEVPSGHLLVSYAWNRPAMYRRQGSGENGLLIDITELKRQVNSDYANLFSLSPEEAIKKISPPLSVLEEEERGLFIEYLSNKLQPRQRRDFREDIHKFTDLSIMFGFMEGYNKINNSAELSKPVKDMSLQEMLAGRSSTLADDSRDVKHGQWFVVNNSQGGVQIKTRETQYLTPMEIGQLALYNKLMDDSVSYELGYVARLMRLGEDELAVTVIKLASYVEAVAIQNAELHKQGGAWPGFLIRSRQGRWQLIVHAKQGTNMEGSSLFIRRKKKLISITLANVASHHQEFTVFNLHTTSTMS